MKVNYSLEYDTEEYKNIHDTLQQLIGAGKDVLISVTQYQHTRDMAQQQIEATRLAAELERNKEDEEGLSDNDIKIEEMALEIQELRHALAALTILLDEDSEEASNEDNIDATGFGEE